MWYSSTDLAMGFANVRAGTQMRGRAQGFDLGWRRPVPSTVAVRPCNVDARDPSAHSPRCQTRCLTGRAGPWCHAHRHVQLQSAVQLQLRTSQLASARGDAPGLASGCRGSKSGRPARTSGSAASANTQQDHPIPPRMVRRGAAGRGVLAGCQRLPVVEVPADSASRGVSNVYRRLCLSMIPPCNI